MSKRRIYHPLSKSELTLYKKNKEIFEARREKFTTAMISALDKIKESKAEESESLKVKIKYLNKYLHNKKQENVLKVFHFWLSDMSE